MLGWVITSHDEEAQEMLFGAMDNIKIEVE